ncbi:MAG TPA: type II toxin-antitoxin system VapC family toxin [Epsilonproteobacteria bacterium]|nr:type II toxin-antitoxin system VapC family toxin [Campylobacterota bacterium]
MGKRMGYLIDSNILIYHLNEQHDASAFLKTHSHESAISLITYIEVLSFPMSDNEEKYVRQLLSKFKVINPDQVVAEKAVENRKVKKIKIPDNIIAASAMVNNLTLVTRNTKDFETLNLQLVNPFDV